MSSFSAIVKQLEQGQRLTAADFLALHRHPQLLELGALADQRNVDTNGEIVWFQQHRLLSVGTVDFIGREDEDPSHDISFYVVDRIAGENLDGITELRLGAFQPDRLSFASLEAIIGGLSAKYPDRRLRALSARQLWQYSTLEGVGIETLASRLADRGNVYLDGRGAGLLGGDGGKRTGGFCSEQWFMVHRLAHLSGMPSDASMEYGLLDGPEQREAHLAKLRAIQDETGGFVSFMPLARQYQQPGTGYYQKTSGADDLRMLALSRLYLDNIPQIHVLWGRVGFDIAQLALVFGANCIEGEITANRNLTRSRTFRSLTRLEAKAMIKKADRIALQRDGVYKPVKIPDPESPQDRPLVNEDNILYKLDNRLDVGLDTLLAAADHVSLLRLGELAGDFSRHHNPHQAIRMTMAAPAVSAYTPALADPDGAAADISRTWQDQRPATGPMVAIDFGGWKHLDGLSLASLSRCLGLLKAAAPSAQVALKGMKGLWQLGSPQELGPLCADLGVTMVESSEKELEEDFTRSERVEFHRELHSRGIDTIPMVRLSAPYAGDSGPFWEAFCQDLLAVRDLHQSTGHVRGIKVLQARHAFVTPCEYLRAVALARIICHDVAEIITPFDEIPTINQARARIPQAKKREALKVLPLCGYFGASDIAQPNPLSRNTALIWEELLHAGITPSLRDFKFNLLGGL